MIDLKELVLMSKEEYDSIVKREEIVREAYSERMGELEEQLKEARYAPMGDNHHNAAQCPHCGAPLREALQRIAELERLIRTGSDGK